MALDHAPGGRRGARATVDMTAPLYEGSVNIGMGSDQVIGALAAAAGVV